MTLSEANREQRPLGSRGFPMNGFGGGTNNVNNQAGMGKHRDVATVNSMGGCIHTLRHETF
jgi:hypothetical protein